jgi:hypothetical protein
MEFKDEIREATVKSLFALMPLLSTKPAESLFFTSAQNYQSYLTIMCALVYILTDENPEIRFFATS